jgi:hypothetical protein
MGRDDAAALAGLAVPGLGAAGGGGGEPPHATAKREQRRSVLLIRMRRSVHVADRARYRARSTKRQTERRGSERLPRALPAEIEELARAYVAAYPSEASISCHVLHSPGHVW